MNVTFSGICRAVLLYTSGVTTFQRMVLRGEGRPPHIPPQTDPTVGLLRNMGVLLAIRLTIKKPQTSYSGYNISLWNSMAYFSKSIYGNNVTVECSCVMLGVVLF